MKNNLTGTAAHFATGWQRLPFAISLDPEEKQLFPNYEHIKKVSCFNLW